MTAGPAAGRVPADGDGSRKAAAQRETAGRATGILMALVPCTAVTARRILDNAARTAGTTPGETARAVEVLRTEDPADVPRALVQVLRDEVDHARTPPVHPANVVLPPPFILRQHLNHLRGARRRTVDAPGDATVRAELESAAYMLCVLMGERGVHGALTAAEEHLACQGLPALLPDGSRPPAERDPR
ncbi:DUF5133 domain-containing protein [Streptomyces sp. G-G2]|uniref:DUF5133 domain-containing protein n=1 Tax=Streptomyces sp. G-G2 TaxID=3046201 RepID=UPI0024B96CF7|nr:DUF5133 domain-containing protein [Streptomyces sp. G-G2]MDJ0386053.1 DUF5133 domain-containing protein [Streptomyces sp. G-G2]